MGIGSYRIDLHPSTGRRTYVDLETWPFQIPLGALIPASVDNLLPGAKNLGTTHVTNGCYRLHPVEWNIGEVAGALAERRPRRKLLDHLVGAGEQGIRHGEPERLRGLQIDQQLELGRLLRW